MNLDFIVKRALGRPTCVLGRGAKLGRRAKILNARDSNQYIRVGDGSIIEGELFVFAHGGDIEIGANCYVDRRSRIWSALSVKIEDDVIIGPNVNVFDSLTHPISAARRHEQVKGIFAVGHPKTLDLSEFPIVIRRGVEIGAGSIILRGVTIGENVSISPGSVITKSIDG